MALSKIDGTNLIAPTIPVASGGTGSATLAGAGLANTPSFYVARSANQTISSASTTKVQFDTEIFDTAGAYDNSTNYRFTVPSGQAGKYYFFTKRCVNQPEFF